MEYLARHLRRLGGWGLLLLSYAPLVRADEVDSNPYIPKAADAQSKGFFTTVFSCTGGQLTTVCILQAVLRFGMSIAFIIALIFLVLGGFRYVTAGGNEDSVEKAKTTIKNSIIGIVVIVLGWVILQFILDLAEGGSAVV